MMVILRNASAFKLAPLTWLALIIFLAPMGENDPASLARKFIAEANIAGGFVVHLGCGAGRLTTALHVSDAFVVHGLDRNHANVEEARAYIRSLHLYGKVSVDIWRGDKLPYVDDIVNLIIAEDTSGIPMSELMRVLAPNGVAFIRRGNSWERLVKPRSNRIDEWTHYLHDPTNNAVAHDANVAPPFGIHWVCEPKYTRHHDRLASISVAVSANGRLFYIVDEAPRMSVLIPPQWRLVARDAFSGILLWKRRISRWWSHMWSVKFGPEFLGRRLVAVGDKVFVTLGLGEPISQLDAATGKTVRVYEGTEGAEEIIYEYKSGILYIATSGANAQSLELHKRGLMAIDAETGKVLWRLPNAHPLPLSLTVGRGKVFYWDGDAIVCLDAKTGKEIWRYKRCAALNRPAWSAPTMVLYDDVLLCADRNPDLKPPEKWRWNAHFIAGGPGTLMALSADTGKFLWSTDCAEGYHSPVDVFVADGLVWVGKTVQRHHGDFTVGLDPHTGEVKRSFKTDEAFKTTMPHHRCYRNKATDRFIIMGRTGVEFIDVRSGSARRHHWVRGTCRFGVLPANGLLYVPPHSCACYIEAKLAGFFALSHRDGSPRPPSNLLERGDAYGFTGQRATSEDDWSTYRHDAHRSGHTEAIIPSDLKLTWQVKLASRLTAPVVAQGKVFVASVDEHTVYALDAQTGDVAWHFTAGGRVDSPPTVHNGFVIFGSRDGWVYCLRAMDGELVWRFRAAPDDKLIIAMNQPESVWAVHGSVLAFNDSVYFVAGRSSYLDGGLYLYRLNLVTGDVLSARRIYSRLQDTGEQPNEPRAFEMPGALPDILSTDGELIYMRHRAFDAQTLEPREPKEHLFSPAGFLDDNWWHRTYWVFGKHFYAGYIGWFFAGREVPAGRILTFNESTIYGFAYKPSYYRNVTGWKYHLFATDISQVKQPPPDYTRAQREFRVRNMFKVKFKWTVDVPLLVRAMIQANDLLFLAGPPQRALRSMTAYEGKRGGLLIVVSTKDGRIVRSYRLNFLPTFDGMAGIAKKLFMTTTDGRVICFGAEGKPLLAMHPERRVKGKPVEEGLVGYWKFDDGKGDTAMDSSGRGNDAEVCGTWVMGKFGTCIYTDGLPGAITICDDPDFQFGTSDFSIAFWVKPDAFGKRIMGKENFPRNWWVINLLDDGRVELVLGETRASGKVARARSKTPLSTRAWNCVTFVVDRKAFTIHCYINGKLDSVTKIPPTLTGSLSVVEHDILIPSAFKPFVGLIDELKIYRRTLTRDEIRRFYEREKVKRTSVEFEAIAWE